MGKLTITLKDDKKLDELLTLVTALPYVEYAQVEGLTTEKHASPSHDDHQADSPFYQDPRTNLMDQQIAAFETMKAGLLAHHLGEYGAIFQGAVVDHDADKALLLSRLGQTHPDAVVQSSMFGTSHAHLSHSAHHGYISIDESAIVEKGSTSDEE